MDKEIIKIFKNEDGSIGLEPVEDITMGEVLEAIAVAVSTVSELVLCDLNDIDAHKRAKDLKKLFSSAVDESYLD